MKLYLIRISLCLFFVVTIVTTPAFALKVGERAPDFSVQDQHGKTIQLSHYQGKVVLVEFWASWCGYCKLLNEELNDIYKAYKSQGFEIISISIDTKPEDWKAAIARDQLTWPLHAIESKGWNSPLVSLYGVDGLPSTYLINENGIIVGVDLFDAQINKKLQYLYYQQIRMYPSEAVTKLFFTAEVKYEIFNAHGVSKLKGKAKEVDVSALEEGKYVINYDGKTEYFYRKKFTLAPPSFYPTRVEDKVTLSRKSDYQVYNGQGGLVLSGHGDSIDMTHQPAGVYYLNTEGLVSTIYKK
ncbi:MAG: TlpA disulfide reductase family protein [Cytophagaceae bacterium]